MNIILTNDDGIDAPGLAALERACEILGARTTVVAPELHESGVGHQVTTTAPITVRPLDSGRFAVSGKPADCSRIALTSLVPHAEWLLAGINRGGNLGSDVYMSGTVAAAREASLLGFRAIAVSQYVGRGREVDWDLSVDRILPVLRRLLANGIDGGHFWNVNLPHPDHAARELEVVFCGLDTRPHGVRFHREGDVFVYTGDYHERPRQPGRDVDVCLSGRIAVTRIPLEIAGSGP